MKKTKKKEEIINFFFIKGFSYPFMVTNHPITALRYLALYHRASEWLN
jgi:hypothetical protein